jgi:hypothetical protein
MEGLRAPRVVELVLDVLKDFQAELERGAVISVKPQRIASRRLPIGGSGDE